MTLDFDPDDEVSVINKIKIQDVFHSSDPIVSFIQFLASYDSFNVVKIGSLSNDDGDVNENGKKKTIVLD